MPSGEWIPHVESYQETATGLNFKNPDTGQWEESSEVIEQISGGAVARHGQHKVIFASDLATFGAIDMEMPGGGQRLRSHLLGLSFFDRASGQSVLIAEVTNCIGQIISTNQVWYDSAFSGLKAGVRYTYTREGLEQDVILEDRPPAPETYGFNSSTTVLQALTEFISPPQPDVSTTSDAAGNQLADQTLSFATMKIGRGRAFLMGDDSRGCPVSKEWVTLEGRQFLIEEVPMSQVAQQLQALPAPQDASSRYSNAVVNVVSAKRLLPAPPLAKAGTNQMQIASLPVKRSGFVLDYTSLNTTQTNSIFQAATTYYLSGNVTLYGTNTTFEGASILKYASGVSLTVNTPVTWTAGPYRPVVMVSKDDNTVGDTISGSSGSPGNSYYASKALYFDGSSAQSALNIKNLRILNATAGIVINSQSNHVLADVQLLKCANGIEATNTDITLRNAVFGNVLTNFTGSNVVARVEHLTSDKTIWLNKDIGSNLFLTNCLLAAVTNLGSCSTQNVANVTSDSGVFQTVGGGSYYLATNSPYCDAGTTGISSNMLAALKQKTTCPPVLYQDTTISVATNFSPTILRDTNAPDLGYHYDPMDYAFSGVSVNTNISFAAGTAVGWFALPADSFGMRAADRQVVTFDGNLASPSYFVRCNTVQEGGNGNWTKTFAIAGIQSPVNQSFEDVTRAAEVRLRFTTSSVLSWGEWTYHDASGYITVRAVNSTFIGGNLAGYVISYYATNCFWDMAQIGQVQGHSGNQFIVQDSTWHNGWLFMTRSSPIPVALRSCAFDNTKIQYAGASDPYSTNSSVTDYSYNAFLSGHDRLSPTNSHDQFVSNFNWQIGPLGSFYLPTNSVLIDAGHTNADLVGLYHFTTQTNQVKETNSVVDIGFHYVALDALGNPVDTDGDGFPDYIEDANGNGIVDTGESSWLLNAYNGLSSANGLQVFTPLK